jgi:hypothetical protein
MPYFINTWRTPKHGHFKEVEKAAQESLKASGKFGNISVTFSSPRPTDSNLKVIGTIAGFETPSDVENFFNSIWEDENRFANLEKINTLCDQSVYLSQRSSIQSVHKLKISSLNLFQGIS